VNTLAEKYPQEIQKILAKYPTDQKRSAVMPLLYLAQREQGFITRSALDDIADLIGVSSTDVASIVGYYTLYYDHPGGKYRIQVCNDLPCALRGADQFLKDLCDNLAIRVGETSSDGLVTVEAVMCLAGCDKAPLFQVQTGEGLTYHENQTLESTLKLVETWREEARSRRRTPSDKAPEETGVQARDDLSSIAEEGLTSLTQEERIQIQEQGGQ
jgi:NADH-quinone oxidoreductase subunit E